jgi:hypothetical protein
MGSTLIALEISQRLGASPLMIMQNLNVIHGRPSWSSQFIIAALNSCGKFSPIRYEMTGSGDSRTCTAWAIDLSASERLEGPPVSIEMAKKEGWFQKNGSKWQTMPELMLRYRAAAFFGRLYAPDILMGMQSEEEVIDIGPAKMVEIKRTVVEQQALPAHLVEPEPNLPENPIQPTEDTAQETLPLQPVSRKKPAAAAQKQLPAEAKPANAKTIETTVEPPEANSKVEQIREKLTSINKDDAALLAICVREKWVKPGASLEDLTEKTLDGLLEFWGEIDEELSAKPPTA